jgi:flagellar hook protein FlgE
MPFTSFYSALTGLTNNALAINVIGNNLANINTTAFKSSKTNFAELLGGLASITASDGNPIQVGLGSTVSGITPLMSQGSIASTGRATDAAISGNGFFVVATPDGGQGYTRAGNFGFTSSGELVNSEGFKVLGYQAVDGVINTNALSSIVIQKGQTMSPKATTAISIMANLDSQAAVDSTFSTSIQIYDSRGAVHNVTVTFKKTDAGWDWSATLPATDTGGKAGDDPVEIGKGSLAFDNKGVLTAPTENPTLTISGLSSGAADMEITFSMLDAKGNPSFTSYASASSVASTTQNGYGTGALTDISIDDSGVITGLFGNGQSQALAQLALADFPNVDGLEKFKGTTFVAFGSSGAPSLGAPGTGDRGSIVGGSLEQSNVDIAQEFTSLILAQRGYQANSRVITTTDEMYQDSINMKR